MDELYQWGRKTRAEYLADSNAIKRQLQKFEPSNKDTLERLASFLKDITRAWDQASQLQRNRLLKHLLESVWIKDKKVISIWISTRDTYDLKKIAQIPLIIKKLETLKKLIIYGNEILNPIKLPKTIGYLTSLTHLILYIKSLNELPHSIMKLKNLKFLDIQKTELGRKKLYIPKELLKRVEQGKLEIFS